MSDLINALNRLERAGSESSRCTKKLHEAASTVADKICDSVRAAKAVGVTLPRGYRVRNVKSNVGNRAFLVAEPGTRDEWGNDDQLWIDGTGGYLHGDFHAGIPEQTREGSLRFAKDVSEGLLNEIAAFLEDRAAENAMAAGTLEAV
jgi:hypothetical protein